MVGECSVKNVHDRHDLGKVDDVLAIMAGREIQMPKSDSRQADDVRVVAISLRIAAYCRLMQMHLVITTHKEKNAKDHYTRAL